MKGEFSTVRKITFAAMICVMAATVFLVRDFTNQAKSLHAPAVSGSADLPEDSFSTADEGSGVQEVDYAAVQRCAQRYAGEWNVEKYFTGEDWKIYELGKRMAILAYNFLNDGSYTTGGYNKIVGYSGGSGGGGICSSCGIGHMKLETGVDALLNSGNAVYRCDFCGAESTGGGGSPIYEYVPEEVHEYHGKDIEYSTPSITITEEAVDMSGMGGPVFGLDQFRVETINGEDYLINDEFRFAFVYDGTYLEYCEPDTYGHFQGYYAFK